MDQDSVDEIGPAIDACWQPPARAAGLETTLRFSLKRNGELLGEPRVTYEDATHRPEDRAAFRDAALQAVRRCVPLNLSPGLGGAIAGRPITVRFVGSQGIAVRTGRYAQFFSR